MSQSGKLSLYRIAPLPGLRAKALQVAQQSGLRVLAASACRGRFSEWRDAFDGPGGAWPTPLPQGWAVEEYLQQYRRPGCLRLWGASRWGETVAAAVTDGIPTEVRGLFVPDCLYLTLGGHDLCEFAEAEHGQLIARASLSVRFFGYHTPNDWQRFRELVFELPGVVAVRQELEEIVGPVKQVVFWSV